MAGSTTAAAQHSPVYSLRDRLHSRRAARCRRWVPMEVSTLRGKAEHLAPLFIQEQPSTRETCVAVVQLGDGDRHAGRDVALEHLEIHGHRLVQFCA